MSHSSKRVNRGQNKMNVRFASRGVGRGFGGRFEKTPLEPFTMSLTRRLLGSVERRESREERRDKALTQVSLLAQREGKRSMAWRRGMAGVGAASAAVSGAAYYYRPDPSGELLESRRTKSPRVRGMSGGCEVVTRNRGALPLFSSCLDCACVLTC